MQSAYIITIVQLYALIPLSLFNAMADVERLVSPF